MSIVLIPLSWFSGWCSFWKRYAKAIQWHYKSFGNAHFAEKYWKSASSSFRTTFSFPPLPSCLVNQPDISWFWQIWHIYEAGYLSAQQEQKSVSFISLANADCWCSRTIFGRDLQDIPDLQYFAVGRVAIYPESRNLFHYTALMTDPNSRGLTNSGNATICNGSTHWSITGGHLLCSPLTPHPPLSSFSSSAFSIWRQM